jgi:hypothetical protein
LELSCEAGFSQQTSHLVFLRDGGVVVCADRDLDREERMDDPQLEICLLPARNRDIARALHRKPVAWVSSGRLDDGLSAGAWDGASPVVSWSRHVLARSAVDVGGDGSITNLVRNSARLKWSGCISA